MGKSMGNKGHKPTPYAITPYPSVEPRHSTLGAALESARPALTRLYSDFHVHRQAQIAEFTASFWSAQGRPPTVSDLMENLEPRISRQAATWYLSMQGTDTVLPISYDVGPPKTTQHEGDEPRRRHQAIAKVSPTKHPVKE